MGVREEEVDLMTLLNHSEEREVRDMTVEETVIIEVHHIPQAAEEGRERREEMQQATPWQATAEMERSILFTTAQTLPMEGAGAEGYGQEGQVVREGQVAEGMAELD